MATQTAATVETILQLISDLRGDSAINTDAIRIRAVSRAERDFALRKFWTTHLTPDQTIGTGDGSTSAFTVGSTTFPMRLNGLFELFVGGTTEDKRYEILPFKDYKIRYNQNNSDRIAYTYYDSANDAWKVKSNPTPASGEAITGSWFWEPPTRTLITEKVICPDMMILVRLGLAYLYEGEDEDKYQENLQIAETLIGKVEGFEETPAVNQLNVMRPIENSGKNRGIGSY